MEVAARLAALEHAKDEQQLINSRVMSQIDALQYYMTLVLKNSAALQAQIKENTGMPRVADGGMILGPQRPDQSWVWIDTRGTGIAEGAFRNSAVAEVLFSGNTQVRKVAKYAFHGCKRLRSFELCRSVTEIGAWAFSGSSLAVVSFPVDASLRWIGDGAFSSVCCESVTLPPSVKTIEEYAFHRCKHLVRVSFGEGSKLTRIGRCAFSECALHAIEVPAGVTGLPARCFEECRALQSVSFVGNLVAKIGAGAFSGCASLRSVLIPASVRVLGTFARNLGVTAGPTGVFANCRLLEEVLFAEGSVLTEIGERCFAGCVALKQVGRAPGLKWIGPRAFSGCELLASLPFPGVEQIGESAFACCRGVSSLEFGPQLHSIGARAFQGCASLGPRVIFPPGTRLRRIGDEAFAGCEALNSLTLPGVDSMGKNVVRLGCALRVTG